jgi:septal ring factor EnvC (AmiA/AmiB activator)
MDKLDKEIEAKARERDAVKDRVTTLRAQIDDITRKHDEAAATLRDYEIELRALTHAASLRPIAPTNDAVATPDVVEPRRGGRQKGSISKKWRRALADLVAAGNQPMDPERFYLLTRGRLGLAESSVKERVRTYVTAGHLEEVNGSRN